MSIDDDRLTTKFFDIKTKELDDLSLYLDDKYPFHTRQVHISARVKVLSFTIQLTRKEKNAVHKIANGYYTTLLANEKANILRYCKLTSVSDALLINKQMEEMNTMDPVMHATPSTQELEVTSNEFALNDEIDNVIENDMNNSSQYAEELTDEDVEAIVSEEEVAA